MTYNDRTTKKLTRKEAKEIEDWYRERILAGVTEEEGSFDCYEDNTGDGWYITKRDDGRFDMTTDNSPLPFAIGMITKTGKARINWN